MYRPSTSRAIAAQGASDYARTLCESPSARTLFKSGFRADVPRKPIRIRDVQRCFVGISAEIVFEEKDIAANPRHIFDETASYINEHLTNFLFFHSPSNRYHLFNLEAAQLIATLYPDYFPAEATLDARVWLQQNWRMWADGNGENCIRYGLLSGFPLEATVRFAQHKRTGQRLPLEQVVYSPITSLSYVGFEAEKDVEYMRELDSIFIESGVKH